MSAPSVEIGINYDSRIASTILNLAGRVKFVAITEPVSENDACFGELRGKFQVLVHNVAGGVCREATPAAIRRLGEMAALSKAPWVVESVDCSETRDGRFSLGSPFAPLYTPAFLDECCRNAEKLCHHLRVPLLVQNAPAYLAGAGEPLGTELWRRGRMAEAEFFARLVKTTGCGMSLHLPSLWASAAALGRPVHDYALEFPLEHVVEMHLGGLGPTADIAARLAGDDELLGLARALAGRAPRLRVFFFGSEPGGLPKMPRAGLAPVISESSTLSDFGLQDALIRALADSNCRHSGRNPAAEFIDLKEFDALGRTIARRYYAAAVRRWYRHTGRLAATTGRRPEAALAGDTADAVLDAAVLGSRVTAVAVAAHVNAYLTAPVPETRFAIPYWEELARHDAAWFIAASGDMPPRMGELPAANPLALQVEMQWDLDTAFRDLGSGRIPVAEHRRIPMIFARDREGEVHALRASEHAMGLLRLADGTRSIGELSERLALPLARTTALVDTLRKFGALL